MSAFAPATPYGFQLLAPRTTTAASPACPPQEVAAEDRAEQRRAEQRSAAERAARQRAHAERVRDNTAARHPLALR